MPQTTVHLMRHGEVHSPRGSLCGRLPGYHLSERGYEMAARVAKHFAGETSESTPAGTTPVRRDITHVIASPLQRAQETATPIAAAFGLELGTDERLIEAGNYFEGKTFGVGDGSLRHPRRTGPASSTRGAPRGASRTSSRSPACAPRSRTPAGSRESRGRPRLPPAPRVDHALLVRGPPVLPRPAQAQCSLASVTSLRFDGDRFVGLDYSEPVADLLPGASKVAGA